MKALTILQPYAELIARGEKRVENRTWRTRYRGPLAIHAGLSRDRLAIAECDGLVVPADDLIFGAIVAVAEFVACVPIDELRLQRPFAEFAELHSIRWLREHEHAHGPWCWVLADVQRLATPIAMAGARTVERFRSGHTQTRHLESCVLAQVQFSVRGKSSMISGDRRFSRTVSPSPTSAFCGKNADSATRYAPMHARKSTANRCQGTGIPIL
jgi:hypothetical protein